MFGGHDGPLLPKIRRLCHGGHKGWHVSGNFDIAIVTSVAGLEGSLIVHSSAAIRDVVTSSTTEYTFCVWIIWLTIVVRGLVVLALVLLSVVLEVALRARLATTPAAVAIEAASETIRFVLPLPHSLYTVIITGGGNNRYTTGINRKNLRLDVNFLVALLDDLADVFV